MVLRISQQDMAEKVGLCGSSYIAQVESGRKQPSVECLEEMAKTLGEDLMEMFEKWTVVHGVQEAAGKDLNKLDETLKCAIARVQELQEGWLIKQGAGK